MTLSDTWRKNWPEVRAALSRGLPRFVLARRPGDLGDAVPVFCYHLVHPDDFGEDLAHLRRNGYTAIDADTLLTHLEQRAPAPPRSVVLSFDDGAANLHRVAFPLLREFRQKAVAFIAPWFHAQAAGDYHLDSPAAGQRPCTWAELRRMHESGLIDVQSHTFEHRYVPHWPQGCDLTGVCNDWVRRVRGPGLEMKDDFRLARSTIEKHLGKTVQHLAFPQFDGTDQAIEIGRTCGYRGFWWGVLPGIDVNRPGRAAMRIVRVNGDLLRRLPGEGRMPLRDVLTRRYGRSRRRDVLRPVLAS